MNNLKEKAITALQNHDFNAVQKILGSAEDLSQNQDADIAYIVGTSYLFQRNDHLADRMLNQCLTLNPNYLSAVEKLTHLYAGNGRYDDVLSLCKQHPNALSKYESIAFFCASSLLLSGNELALAEYWPSLKNQISSVEVISEIGLIYAMLGMTSYTQPIFDVLVSGTLNETLAYKTLEYQKRRLREISTSDALEQLHQSYNGEINKAWILFQLSRYKPISQFLNALASSPPTFQLNKDAYNYLAVPIQASQLVSPQELRAPSTPVIHAKKVNAGIESLRHLATKMKNEGKFDIILSNITSARKRNPQKLNDPIFILSTGRCGTMALYYLLENTMGITPFHSYPWQIKHGDRNHLLYRIMTGDVSTLTIENLIMAFVEARSAEILYAYINNTQPCLIGHWDTIFTPVWSILFPESTFIHLHRNSQAVSKSIISKNQWNNAQLQYLKYDAEFRNDKFCFAFDTDHSLIENVCWYLHVTKIFCQEFGKQLDKDHFMDLSADNLFNHDAVTSQELSTFIANNNLDASKISQHYKKPLNQKTHRTIPQQNDTFEKVETILQQIEATGKL